MELFYLFLSSAKHLVQWNHKRVGLFDVCNHGCKSVNVGQIIHWAIIKVIRGTTTTSLALPRLITDLYNFMDVERENTEEQLLLKSDIDKSVRDS